MNMSALDNEKYEAKGRLRYLYVILGRLCGKEQYIWEEYGDKEQTLQYKLFMEEYNKLKLIENKGGNDLETRFTVPDVLGGFLSIDDRNRAINKSLISQLKDDIDLKGETVLHRAISYLDGKGARHNDDLNRIIDTLLEDIPGLLKHDRSVSQEYKGQSPLHLAVLKEDTMLVEKITEKMIEKKYPLDPVAKGTKFEGTAMMAGTPLCVSALKFNKQIFTYLLKKGANIAGRNKDLDNVCHSLIHYARNCPKRLKCICKMLNFVLNADQKGLSSDDTPQKLLMMENRDGLNPLQLATKHHFPEIFKQLYQFEVYCERIPDLLRDDQLYDITEIDTIPVHKSRKKVIFDGNAKKETITETENHASVLPTLLLQSPQTSIKFLEFPPVQQVIEQKWDYYKWYILMFGILHLAFMVLLTSSAARRAQLTNDPFENPNESLTDLPKFEYKVGDDEFVTGASIVGLVYGLVQLIIEARIIIANYSKKVVKKITFFTIMTYPHSNIIYRMLFMLLSLCMVLDFIFAITQYPRYENFCLIAAVIIGWYVILFFVQMIKPFSFFTSLIQTVMIDLIRFAVIMVIFLIGFSTAMYMVMQGADIEDDTFKGFRSTTMKMFTIMIGLGEINSFFYARYPGLTITVFILFVLLTTILLLNALLAIMANTCASLLDTCGDLTAYTLHFRLQQLSAILLIEDVLWLKLQKDVGEIHLKRRLVDGKFHPDIKRRVIQITSLTAITGIKGHSKRSKKRIYPKATIHIDGNVITGDATVNMKSEDQKYEADQQTGQNSVKPNIAIPKHQRQTYEAREPTAQNSVKLDDIAEWPADHYPMEVQAEKPSAQD